MTCFLEYGERTVEVHDIIHERVESRWVTRVSSYPKVRLSPDWARASLEAAGIEASIEPAPRGMVRLTARAE